jgi:hypothetical protein
MRALTPMAYIDSLRSGAAAAVSLLEAKLAGACCDDIQRVPDHAKAQTTEIYGCKQLEDRAQGGAARVEEKREP